MKIFISHNDLDGIGCILLNEYFELKFDKIHIISYENILDDHKRFIFPYMCPITKEDDVTICDISMIPVLYNYIKDNAKSYIIFDHHEDTRILTIDSNIYYEPQEKHMSGTKIYFNYLSKGKRVSIKIIELVDLISVYDTFYDESPLWEEAQNLNRLYYKIYSWGLPPSLASNKFIDNQVKKIKNKSILNFFFTDIEKFKIEEAKAKESEMYTSALKNISIRKDNIGHTFAVIILPTKISITCYNLLKNLPDIDYILVINSYRGINGKVSARMRKNKGLNSNKLKNINGHVDAGGGEFSINFLINFMNDKNAYLEYEE